MAGKLEIIATPAQIASLVENVAEKIRSDFPCGKPVLVGVLKGAFVFLSDLARSIDIPVETDFIQSSAYGQRSTPAEPEIKWDLTFDVKGRDVIIVEGIIDRGITMHTVKEHILKKGPSSIRICSLLLRSGSLCRHEVDYVGMEIGPGFIVGYGMDYKENYRNLPGIYVLEDP